MRYLPSISIPTGSSEEPAASSFTSSPASCPWPTSLTMAPRSRPRKSPSHHFTDDAASPIPAHAQAGSSKQLWLVRARAPPLAQFSSWRPLGRARPAPSAVCDTTRDRCVQCLSPADCLTTADCIDNRCRPYVPCDNSLDCLEGQVCDAARSHCVLCARDADCGDNRRCVDNTCRRACQSDSDAGILQLTVNAVQ